MQMQQLQWDDWKKYLLKRRRIGRLNTGPHSCGTNFRSRRSIPEKTEAAKLSFDSVILHVENELFKGVYNDAIEEPWAAQMKAPKTAVGLLKAFVAGYENDLHSQIEKLVKATNHECGELNRGLKRLHVAPLSKESALSIAKQEVAKLCKVFAYKSKELKNAISNSKKGNPVAESLRPTLRESCKLAFASGNDVSVTTTMEEVGEHNVVKIMFEGGSFTPFAEDTSKFVDWMRSSLVASEAEHFTAEVSLASVGAVLNTLIKKLHVTDTTSLQFTGFKPDIAKKVYSFHAHGWKANSSAVNVAMYGMAQMYVGLVGLQRLGGIRLEESHRKADSGTDQENRTSHTHRPHTNVI